VANEITVLSQSSEVVGTNPDDTDRVVTRIGLLFLYPVASPIQVGGTNVVPTPSNGLPEIGGRVLDQSEKDALDAGTWAFEVVSYTVRPEDQSMTNAQHLARAQEIYASRLATWLAAYDERWGGRVGSRFNAT